VPGFLVFIDKVFIEITDNSVSLVGQKMLHYTRKNIQKVSGRKDIH